MKQSKLKAAPEAKWFFHLMSATVVFDIGDGPLASDIQFLANASVSVFTADRLTQIQNQAAHIARQKIYDGMSAGETKPEFKVIDVTLGGFHFLGHMTMEEFYGQPTEQLSDGSVADPGETPASN